MQEHLVSLPVGGIYHKYVPTSMIPDKACQLAVNKDFTLAEGIVTRKGTKVVFDFAEKEEVGGLLSHVMFDGREIMVVFGATTIYVMYISKNYDPETEELLPGYTYKLIAEADFSAESMPAFRDYRLSCTTFMNHLFFVAEGLDLWAIDFDGNVVPGMVDVAEPPPLPRLITR